MRWTRANESNIAWVNQNTRLWITKTTGGFKLEKELSGVKSDLGIYKTCKLAKDYVESLTVENLVAEVLSDESDIDTTRYFTYNGYWTQEGRWILDPRHKKTVAKN